MKKLTPKILKEIEEEIEHFKGRKIPKKYPKTMTKIAPLYSPFALQTVKQSEEEIERGEITTFNSVDEAINHLNNLKND